MPSLKSLPRDGSWEIGLFEAPMMQVEGEELRGILLVVDREQGAVRHASPVLLGQDLDLEVARAATRPMMQGIPTRPFSIHCRPELAKELRRSVRLLGAKLVLCKDLPLAAEAASALMEGLAPSTVWLPANPLPWRSLIKRLVKLQPWSVIPDCLLFHFPAGFAPLKDAVAILLGMAGEQYGVAIYPTQQDHQRFLAQLDKHGSDATQDWAAWAIHLDPIEEVSKLQRAACAASGLSFDTLGLVFLVFDREGPRPMTEAEEEACKLALQGILGAFEAHGEGLLAAPRLTEVPIGSVMLTVSTSLGARAGLAADAPLILTEHQVGIGALDDRPALFVNMAARDARKLARDLEAVDALTVDRSRGKHEIVAWAGDRRIGVLTRGAFAAGAWDDWLRWGAGVLAVSAGGAKRSQVNQKDFVQVFDVTLREPLGGRATDDGLFHPGALDGASWAGPPQTWPKASTVLLDFAEPLGVEGLPAQAVEPIVLVACTIWNAVVFADQAGKPQFLADVRAKLTTDKQRSDRVEGLIRRKRERYPQDHRLMLVESCTPGPGRLDLRVAWRMP